ncbi:MAG TPA: cyclic nucleotide-binding domain-containing protein [Candidatus Baltobacteraceae bacterium]
MHPLDIFRHDDAHAESYAAGATLFNQGESADYMYVVVEGAIDIRIGETILETVTPGGMIGEMALIEQLPRSATAVAAKDSKVSAVDRKRFLFLVQNHPFFALQVMEVLANRLRRMDDTLTKVLPEPA